MPNSSKIVSCCGYN